MSKPIGNPRTINAQDDRECFRLEIEIGGTAANPTYTTRARCNVVTRDAGGALVGQAPGYVTVEVADADLPQALRSGITNILAKIDTL